MFLGAHERSPTPIPIDDQGFPAPMSAQLALELLFSAATSFLLTSALLPLFGLHPSVLTVLRVTGVCTLVVFSVLDFVFAILRRDRPDSPAIVPNPEFKLTPRSVRDVEGGWQREKIGV
ncbi:hypothetical protein DFH07DRAFT_969908 [Mycena maculata]|uniref:Uncharacterized protein n=1 Tax=Mycena maculata TaxID=230809 RepID=A0AAD7HV33_9AGAR|nr:hypothetical protein DFH07DRAFT_969908 [Mycena maculata]